MIIIADSGSTKCNWALCNSEGGVINIIKTIGFNPLFISHKEILDHLNNSKLSEIKSEVNCLFFYGAGCCENKKDEKLFITLSSFFFNASISIKNDLSAACYALYDNRPNITCILGTGSNSCFFDGKKITQNTPSLGFILADEGSGNYFGKKLLSFYFHQKLPNSLKRKFENKYNTSLNFIKSKIYNEHRPNEYLASFFPFIYENKDHVIFKNLIHESINVFFIKYIHCYDNYQDLEINFLGSVAFLLKDEIQTILKQHNSKIGKIVKDPIKKLVQYHFTNIKK